MAKNNKIFNHTDPDADCLNVGPNTLGGLRFKIEEEDIESNVDLDIRAVNKLYETLGAWLSRNDTAARPADGTPSLLSRDAILALAREEFEKLFTERTRPAVLPLWESPVSGAVSRPCGGCSPMEPDAEDGWIRSVPDPADVPEDPSAPVPAPRLMSAVRRRTAPAPIHCERCSHPYADHEGPGCTYTFISGRECTCSWSTG